MTEFRVDQIDHVELFVPDRHAAAAWYEKTLGLAIATDYVQWAADPNGPLMLTTSKAGTMLALFTGEPKGRKPTAGFHRVAFRVNRAGFNAFLEHINQNPVFNSDGTEVRGLNVRDHGLSQSVYFCDPYGHPLEVTTYEVGQI